MKKDEADVTAVVDALSSAINPWDTDNNTLVSLTSGITASAESSNDLLRAEQQGDDAVSAFFEDRFNKKELSMFAPIKLAKLKTFASVTSNSKSTNTAVNSTKANSIFGRLIVVARARNVDLEQLLQYSLSPVSLPLCSADGMGLAKSPKSHLLHHIQSQCNNDDIYELQPDTNVALIIDAMALVQSLSKSQVPDTFGELSSFILHKITQMAKFYKASRVDFVIDRYQDVSTKSYERKRRAADSSYHLKVYSDAQKVPKQWKKFLRDNHSKNHLLEFIVNHWKKISVEGEIEVIATTRTECFRYQFDSGLPVISDIPELASDHEEADTRLVLHAAHASAGHSTVLVYSPDTDVAVMLIHYSKEISATVYLIFSTRTLNTTLIAECIGDMASVLIQIHSLSGCDTTSSFYGKGKKKLYSIVQSNHLLDSIRDLGAYFNSDISALTLSIEPVICLLYSEDISNTSVNSLRYQMFCSKTQNEKNLPPTQDALQQHILRANYQAAIWRRALEPKIDAPTPHGHGWKVQNGAVDVIWMEKQHAPPEVLQVTFSFFCGEN